MSVAALLLAAAVLAGAGPELTRRLTGPAAVARNRTARVHPAGDRLALASALDVFAVCLSAGMTVSAAASATAPSAPPVLAAVLRRAAHLLALGANAETAWSADTDDATCESLMRLARRSAISGAVLAGGVTDLADRARQDAAHHGAADAERAGVLIAGPLGLCFLPAFVCLGIVPVVAGLAGDVFGGVLP